MILARPFFSAVRHQPIATKPAAVRRRFIGHVMTLFAIGIVMLLLFVWTRVKVIELGYEVSRIRKETTSLTEQRDILKAEVAALKSPERIESIARERFIMRLPMSDEVVIVQNPGFGTRDPGPGKPPFTHPSPLGGEGRGEGVGFRVSGIEKNNAQVSHR